MIRIDGKLNGYKYTVTSETGNNESSYKIHADNIVIEKEVKIGAYSAAVLCEKLIENGLICNV